MDQISDLSKLQRERPDEPVARLRRWRWRTLAIGAAAAFGLVSAWLGLAPHPGNRAAAAVTPTPVVTVSQPLQREVDVRAGFLGQFSAIDRVELRAQVGGTLTEIQDGQIVRKGDLLFVIDPRPYEIKLERAKAALQTATARVALANNQLFRAQSLKRSEFATQETVDQRTNDHDASQAAVEDARARVHDAELDLEYARVRAITGASAPPGFDRKPGRGQPRRHQPTLLTTLVRRSPSISISMSESDFLTFARARPHYGRLPSMSPQRREQLHPQHARLPRQRSTAPAAPLRAHGAK
jgi:multidrug efflux pump subunit AcrA (membrane-fusion protein)